MQKYYIDPSEIFNELLSNINIQYENPDISSLYINLLNLLRMITLLNWSINTASDVLDDYNWEKFSDKFPFWGDNQAVIDDYEKLEMHNYNYYFILIMVFCEKFMNDCITRFETKCPPNYTERKSNYEYFLNEAGEICFRILTNSKPTPDKYLINASITQKLKFFNHFFNTEKPKLPYKKRHLNEKDFEFYSLIRNILLHENGVITDGIDLSIYSQIEPSIVNNNKILVNPPFFICGLKQLVNICLENKAVLVWEF